MSLYFNIPFRKWRDNLPFARSRMNLFRSKEHAPNWPEFEPGTEVGIISLQDWASLMSTPRPLIDH